MNLNCDMVYSIHVQRLVQVEHTHPIATTITTGQLWEPGQVKSLGTVSQSIISIISGKQKNNTNVLHATCH